MKKILIVFSIVIGLILIVDGILYFCFKHNLNDKHVFAKEYNISSDNVYIYASENKVYNLLKNGTGVILFGNKDNKWISSYASVLNEVAKEEEIKKIYYLDISNINKKDYEKITSLLGSNLLNDEFGEGILKTPNLSVVLDGIIIGNNNLTSLETGNPKDYWSEEKIKEFKNTLKRMLKPYVYETCITCR